MSVETAIVERGYDAIAETYLAWRLAGAAGDPTIRMLDRLDQLLAPGARVLELGCGAGEPVTRRLAGRYEVTAIDVSAEQAERARRAVPGATVLHADALELACEPGSFDAVVTVYVLGHVPREALGALLDGIALWLDADGLLLASFGIGDVERWVGRWLGAEMHFSSWDPRTNRALVEGAGLDVLADELVTMVEGAPEPGEVTFQWLLARR
jgi:SAM-dependent methyltransferase